IAAQQGAVERAPIDSATGLPGGAADRRFPSAPIRDVSFRYFGAATWDFGLDTLTFGFAVSAPWDAFRSFPDDGSGSSLALPTGYHLASESFRNLFFSVALALKLHPRWLIGLALSPVDSFADLTFYRDSALDGAQCDGAPCGFENPRAATRIR